MKEKIGLDFYTVLKNNNKSVWAILFIASVCSIGSLIFSWKVYQQATHTAFAIDSKGELLPLKMLSEKEDRLIEAKANIEYFVSQYYSLDAYNMKAKRERVLWLVGKQPTEVIKDRASKGYFDSFLSLSGLTQNAQILQNTLQITKTAPYEAKATVRIERVNGGVSEYYNCYIKLRMEEVNRNYPYNPYGLLITQFSENLEKLAIEKKEDVEKDIQISNDSINQNPKSNGGATPNTGNGN